MMKKKKGIVLILISLIIVAMVGIISYNLFKKDISTKQLQSGVTSTVNADTEVKNYTLTFIDRDSDRKVEISASSSDTIKSKLEVAEQKFNDIYSDSFATYREDGYKYEFSKSDDIIKRWSTNESIWVPITSAYVGGNSTLYAMYDKTPTTEKFNYKIDLIKDAVTGGPTGVTSGPNALYIVKNTGKIYTDPSCENKDEVVDHTVKVPTKEGYIFNGTSDGTIDLNGIVNVDYLINRSKVRDRKENVKWKLNEYKITYNGIENCMYSPNPATYTIETDTITLNNPTKSGYIFKGWTGSNGETPQKTVTIPKGSVGNKTYTANWEKTSTDSGRAYDLKVHFLLNEGTDGQQTLYRKKDVGFYKDAECTDENKVKPGVDNEIKIPTRTGYIFKGYTCTVAGKTYEISDKGNISISQYNDLIGKDLSFFEGYLSGGELEFKAQWSNIYHHIITLNPDNGEQSQKLYVINTGDNKRGIYKNEACDEDNKVVANTDGQINIPSKTGYTFVGYTGISKTGSIDTLAMNYFIDGITENTEFKANWEAKKYRIVLNKNDGTDSKDYLYVKYGDGIYKDENYEHKYELNGVGITIDDKTPTRDGYIFDGFAEDREGNGLQINSAGETASGTYFSLINKDTTKDYNLYAKWIPVYYLEFLINDGDTGTYSAYISKDMKMYEDKNCTKEMSKIPVAERKGFIFDGYSLEDDTTNSFDTEGKLIDESPLVKNIKAGVYKAGDSIKLNGKWKNIYDYKIKLNSDNDGGASKYLYVVKTGTKKGIYKNEECDKCELSKYYYCYVYSLNDKYFIMKKNRAKHIKKALEIENKNEYFYVCENEEKLLSKWNLIYLNLISKKPDKYITENQIIKFINEFEQIDFTKIMNALYESYKALYINTLFTPSFCSLK